MSKRNRLRRCAKIRNSLRRYNILKEEDSYILIMHSISIKINEFITLTESLSPFYHHKNLITSDYHQLIIIYQFSRKHHSRGVNSNSNVLFMQVFIFSLFLSEFSFSLWLFRTNTCKPQEFSFAFPLKCKLCSFSCFSCVYTFHSVWLQKVFVSCLVKNSKRKKTKLKSDCCVIF